MATEATTKVSKETINLDELLGTPGPGADNIMVPEESKPNVFTRKQVDLKYLDEKDTTSEKKDTKAAGVKGTSMEGNDPIGETTDPKEIVAELTNTDPEAEAKPKAAKGSIADTIKSLVKSGKLIPFDDDKPLDEYTAKDLEELLDANYAEKESKLRNQIPVDFFQSLPEELQVAAKYHADGGRDMKGLFRALAQAEEVQALDHTDPKNYEKIIRQFLTTTKFGTQEEIDEEIAGLKDRDELEKKAGQFKPKLDKMQEEIIGQKLAEQEHKQAQQAAAAKAYVGSVYKTLEPGELNGIKLDRKTQETLYSGLIQTRYPSISGKPTNLLGHLLEKFQFVEPRHDLIAETLWLLSDPEGYKNRLREQGKNGAVEKTVRMLKTEESNKTPGSTIIEKEETTTRRIPRTSPNFFKRA